MTDQTNTEPVFESDDAAYAWLADEARRGPETPTTDDERESLIDALMTGAPLIRDYDWLGTGSSYPPDALVRQEVGEVADVVLAWMNARHPSPPTEEQCEFCGWTGPRTQFVGSTRAAIAHPDGPHDSDWLSALYRAIAPSAQAAPAEEQWEYRGVACEPDTGDVWDSTRPFPTPDEAAQAARDWGILDPSDGLVLRVERRHKAGPWEPVEAAARVEDEAARAALQEIADHGLRFDLNPTMQITTAEDVYAQWAAYARRMDESVRAQAREALAAAAPDHRE